tara:strand:- start:9657 stop:9944 length:288 start_codon:yes stop_codon:yes gene_type:complete
VSNTITFADLAFLPYNDRIEWFLGVPAERRFDRSPIVKAWHTRMTGRKSWLKCMETRERLIDEQELTMTSMPMDVGDLKEYEEHIGTSESPAAAE